MRRATLRRNPHAEEAAHDPAVRRQRKRLACGAKHLKLIRLLNWKDSYMWQRLPAFIREWSILIFGLLLIVPFLYLSSHETSSSKSIQSTSSLSQNDGSAAPPVAANAPAPSALAPTPAKSEKGSAQAPAKDTVMSHENMA